ncbi:MAG: hypothetical protein ACREBW_04075, partial [Candidatus Micrarchaeaceae archaeon]
TGQPLAGAQFGWSGSFRFARFRQPDDEHPNSPSAHHPADRQTQADLSVRIWLTVSARRQVAGTLPIRWAPSRKEMVLETQLWSAALQQTKMNHRCRLVVAVHNRSPHE